MMWRATVERWHGGQLVMAWGLVVGLVVGGMGLTQLLATWWVERQADESIREHLQCLAAPRASDSQGMASPLGTREWIDVPRVGFPLGCRVPLTYASNRAQRIQRQMVIGAGWGLVLLLTPPSLWLTWGWFGARAPRAKGDA